VSRKVRQRLFSVLICTKFPVIREERGYGRTASRTTHPSGLSYKKYGIGALSILRGVLTKKKGRVCARPLRPSAHSRKRPDALICEP